MRSSSKVYSVVCVGCRQPFFSRDSRQRERARKFCTPHCYMSHMREHGRPTAFNQVAKVCIRCEKTFSDRASKIGKRRFCSVACRGAWQSALPFEAWRGKLSANTENRARGRRNGMFGVTPPHPAMISYQRRDGITIRLRSTWEVTVARYLDAIGENWDYEPRRFDLGETSYVPDFYLRSAACYWEVKGWFHAKAREKIAVFRSAFPDVPLVVIDKTGYGLIQDSLAKVA